MIPDAGEVLHFSEDPTITVFQPRVSVSSGHPEALVWAVGPERAADYWFPRACPRAMAWLLPSTSAADRDALLGPGGGYRVHAVEYSWLDAMRSVALYAYRLPAPEFVPFGTPVHAHIARDPVRPLGPPERVANLFALHESAGIQLRVLDNLWPFWDAVTKSSLGFSGIRMANAQPRRAA